MSIRLNITNLYARIAVKKFLRNNKVCKKNDKLIEKYSKKKVVYKSLRMSAMEYNI